MKRKNLLEKFIIIIMISCPFTGFSQNNNNADSARFSAIEQILTKSELNYEDYKAIFSGDNPVALTALIYYNENPTPINTIRALVLEKLYRSAIEMSNAIPVTKDDETNAKNIISGLFLSGDPILIKSGKKKWTK
jgi:hypothetical protein